MHRAGLHLALRPMGALVALYIARQSAALPLSTQHSQHQRHCRYACVATTTTSNDIVLKPQPSGLSSKWPFDPASSLQKHRGYAALHPEEACRKQTEQG